MADLTINIVALTAVMIGLIVMEPASGFLWVAAMSILLPSLLRYLFYNIIYIGKFRPSSVINIRKLEIAINDAVTFNLKSGKKTTLNGSMLEGLPKYVQYEIQTQTANRLVVVFNDFAKLIITYQELEDGDDDLYNVSWESLGASQFSDSFSLLCGHWYGAGHIFDQPWPLEKWNTSLGPFITGEAAPFTFGFLSQLYGGVQERYWLCSSGVAIHADFNIPLFVSTNYQGNDQLKLVTKHSSPYQNNHNSALKLSYSILQSKDARQAHSAAIKKFFKKPSGIPSKQMFKYPVWSTWAQYKKNITQDSVLQFADDIRKNGFKDSQIEIDDDWTPHYGDFDFDKKKFPEPKLMVDKLKEKGFLVTIWMHPFITPTGSTFWNKLADKFWVRYKFFDFPAIVSWWDGYSGLLDVTDKTQTAWFKDRLKYLQTQYGIDSFKFDAGDAIRLSTWTKCKTALDNPNVYTREFAQMCAESDTELRAQELRVCTGNQDMPMFVRLQDKDSNWGSFNGLKTVIPHVLTQGLLGYPFVLPDMIGGNAYGVGFPDRELYIRWIQVNALMPAMQFSVVPWRYDDEVISIAKNMCDLHEQYSDTIIDLAEEAVRTGYPICRPLWWISPDDETALTISTEFLLGDDILVAPVLDQGVHARDIYLPLGQWQDQHSKTSHTGPSWIRNHPAPLDVLPIFIRQK